MTLVPVGKPGSGAVLDLENALPHRVHAEYILYILRVEYPTLRYILYIY